MNGALSWLSGSDLVTDVFKVSSWASSDAEMPDILASLDWKSSYVDLCWLAAVSSKSAKILSAAIQCETNAGCGPSEHARCLEYHIGLNILLHFRFPAY